MQKIRQKHRIPADKEIAYKHIHKDDSILSALPEIVQVSRKLNGFLFTLAIENSIRSVFGSQQENVETARAANLRFIRSGPLERALRVSYSIAYWLSVFVREYQRAIWVTDRDEIVASPKIARETYTILSNALVQTRYAGAKIGNSEVCVLNVVDYEHFPGRDLLAIPDLAAGAVARSLSDIQESDFKVQRGIDTVLDLVTPQAGEALGSVIFTIDPPHNDGMVRWFARRR